MSPPWPKGISEARMFLALPWQRQASRSAPPDPTLYLFTAGLSHGALLPTMRTNGGNGADPLSLKPDIPSRGLRGPARRPSTFPNQLLNSIKSWKAPRVSVPLVCFSGLLQGDMNSETPDGGEEWYWGGWCWWMCSCFTFLILHFFFCFCFHFSKSNLYLLTQNLEERPFKVGKIPLLYLFLNSVPKIKFIGKSWNFIS